MCFLLHCHLDEKALWQIAKSPRSKWQPEKSTLPTLSKYKSLANTIKRHLDFLPNDDSYNYTLEITHYKLQRWNLWSKRPWKKWASCHKNKGCFLPARSHHTEAVYSELGTCGTEPQVKFWHLTPYRKLVPQVKLLFNRIATETEIWDLQTVPQTAQNFWHIAPTSELCTCTLHPYQAATKGGR